MTDTASIFDPPAVGEADANGAEDPHVCPECGERFEGPLWGMKKGAHRKKEHGVAGARAKERGKGDAAPPGVPDAGGERPPQERPPKTPTRARVNLSELGTGAWKGLSFLAGRSERWAASRMFQLQADAAGPAVDRALKGTWADRKMLQPIARIGGQGKDAATLLGAPIAAQTFLENQNPFTEKAFLSALEASLPQIIKSAKEAKKRQEKMEADLAGMAEVFGKAPGEKVSLHEVARWVCTGSTEPVPIQPPPAQPEAQPA